MKFQEQLRLFDIPESKSQSRRWPKMFHLIILDAEGEYDIWQGGFSLAQAKKLAAKKYNRAKGFHESNFVLFSNYYKMYKR